MKIVLVLMMVVFSLFAGSYHFDETRYVYSIDKTLEMKGKITFDEKGMRIDYSAPEVRHIIYDGLSMDVLNSDDKVVQHIDLDEQPMMKVYLDFIHKLYRGDYEALSENFKVQKTQTVIILTPIPPIDKVVKSVLVHQTPKGLAQIKTKMSNGDTITLHISQ